MSSLLCPSMMCADISNLKDEVEKLDKAGIDIFHCDIMDGNFVPNFALGLNDVSSIRKYTNTAIDVHLMVKKPDTLIEKFAEAGADIIYIHAEGHISPEKTIDAIRKHGKKPGLAISPATPVAAVTELLKIVDYVLVMTVSPGFAGQKFLPFVDEKIGEIASLKKKYDFKVLVDGAISADVIREYSKKGVDGFILGTSSLFRGENDYSESIKALREP